MEKIGFDNEKYLKAQIDSILDRVKKFNGKLYLEFGGKLCYDYHAARVLPGYHPNAKIEILKILKDKIEIIFCVSAKHIEDGRIRGDFGLTYDNVTIKTIEDLKEFGLEVSSVVINRFSGEKRAQILKNYLERLNVKVYLQKEIEGYPTNIDLIVSDDGYGQNPYIETKNPIVVVAGAGPGSGKMSLCLSQVYHESKRGISSGFAKWETFPIWNLPLEHPVNVAYESATADIGDFNVVDPFHLSNYVEVAVSYNRDVENFSIVKAIIDKIIKSDNPMSEYKSPTDMGVNKVRDGIIKDEIVRKAAKEEIIRRWFRYNKEFIAGICDKNTLSRMEIIMQKAGVKDIDRKVVLPAREAEREAKEKGKGHKGIYVGCAIELPDGSIVKGKNSPLLHAESATIINAIKKIANIPDEIDLLSPKVIKNIVNMKENILGEAYASLSLEETLIALAVGIDVNPMADICAKALSKLRGCEMHITHMPTPGDENGLRKIGVNYTTDGKPTLQNYIGR